ncbi:hypothetical protein J6590_023308 [Homalodisca vitripennis]|nr:hypothetical protein J6590_023308 [Homalodisca vitripennis]
MCVCRVWRNVTIVLYTRHSVAAPILWYGRSSVEERYNRAYQTPIQTRHGTVSAPILWYGRSVMCVMQSVEERYNRQQLYHTHGTVSPRLNSGTAECGGTLQSCYIHGTVSPRLYSGTAGRLCVCAECGGTLQPCYIHGTVSRAYTLVRPVGDVCVQSVEERYNRAIYTAQCRRAYTLVRPVGDVCVQSVEERYNRAIYTAQCRRAYTLVRPVGDVCVQSVEERYNRAYQTKTHGTVSAPILWYGRSSVEDVTIVLVVLRLAVYRHDTAQCRRAYTLVRPVGDVCVQSVEERYNRAIYTAQCRRAYTLVRPVGDVCVQSVEERYNRAIYTAHCRRAYTLVRPVGDVCVQSVVGVSGDPSCRVFV